MRRTGLFRLLCALLAAAALRLPARAARAVPVQVDGGTLDCAAYLEEGVTYVPLRALLDHLGDWEIWWDRELAAARADGEGVRLTADPAAGCLTVNGRDHAARVSVVEGVTYVPLRVLMEALGNDVVWDPWLGGAAVTTAEADYDAVDYYWLSHIIGAESGGEPLEGQIAVGSVVLNRVESEDFPDTVPEVIFEVSSGVTQFEPVENGTVYREPEELSREAARRALDGENTIGEALFFYAPALSQGLWINENRPYHQTIGCHRFYL